jgi:hypothetical protein
VSIESTHPPSTLLYSTPLPAFLIASIEELF